MSSFNKINYNLRLSKNIERKMIVEGSSIIQRNLNIDEYQYIGFGSTFFSDFRLFYKALNITEMISIEKLTSNKERFIFNKPYGFVELKFGESSDILPTLNLDKPSIIWLDYDGLLEESCFSDFRTVIENVALGSILLISVNAMPIQMKPMESEKLFDFRINELNNLVGSKRVPTDIKNNSLSGWEFANTLVKIIHSEVQKSINNRKAISDNSNITFNQAFNFRYQDGTKMLTYGGVICQQCQDVNGFGLNKLDYYCPDISKSYKLLPSILTKKEMMFLDSENEQVSTKFLNRDTRKVYNELSRYYPFFSEVDA